MSMPTPEPTSPGSNVLLVRYLSSNNTIRSRTFLILKCILFFFLMIIILETTLYLPICIGVIQDKMDNPPPPETKAASASDILLFTVIYFSFRILVITLGILGCVKESFALLIVHVCLIPFVVLLILAMFYQAYRPLLYLSSGINLIAFILTLYLAILIRKSQS